MKLISGHMLTVAFVELLDITEIVIKSLSQDMYISLHYMYRVRQNKVAP